MNSSQPRSDAERAAAYQKYGVARLAPVKNKVHDTKEAVQVAAEQVTQQAKIKASEVKQPGEGRGRGGQAACPSQGRTGQAAG